MIAKIASALTGGLIVAALGASLFTITLPFATYTTVRLDIIALVVFWLAALGFTLISANACASWKWQMRLSAVLSFAIAVYSYQFPEMIVAINDVDFYQVSAAEVISVTGLFAGMVFLYLALIISTAKKNRIFSLVKCDVGTK